MRGCTENIFSSFRSSLLLTGGDFRASSSAGLTHSLSQEGVLAFTQIIISIELNRWDEVERLISERSVTLSWRKLSNLIIG